MGFASFLSQLLGSESPAAPPPPTDARPHPAGLYRGQRPTQAAGGSVVAGRGHTPHPGKELPLLALTSLKWNIGVLCTEAGALGEPPLGLGGCMGGLSPACLCASGISLPSPGHRLSVLRSPRAPWAKGSPRVTPPRPDSSMFLEWGGPRPPWAPGPGRTLAQQPPCVALSAEGSGAPRPAPVRGRGYWRNSGRGSAWVLRPPTRCGEV